MILGLAKSMVDPLHLFSASPLYALIGAKRNTSQRQAKFAIGEDGLRDRLADRKAGEKLPERRAFWELLRIVWTETPQSFTDAMRFAMVKLLTLTGLRIGEVCLIPLDWKRIQEYQDQYGNPADVAGGFSTAIKLRHFAEKQGTVSSDFGALYETTQFMPKIFEDVLCKVLFDVEIATAPLRATLRSQCETGRIFPMFRPDELVDADQMYRRLTGNSLFSNLPDKLVVPLVQRYRETLDCGVLDELVRLQQKPGRIVARSVYRYFNLLREKDFPVRTASGDLFEGSAQHNGFFRIDDTEDLTFPLRLLQS